MHACAYARSLEKCLELCFPGANLTIVSYNGSFVKIYNATSSQVSFENKNIFIYFERKKCSMEPTRTLALYIDANSKVVGLAHGPNVNVKVAERNFNDCLQGCQIFLGATYQNGKKYTK
jgi:hypothetical protein